MNKQIEGIIHRPFAPTIGQYKLSDETVKKINQYVDDIRSDQEKIQNTNYGNQLAGEVTHEIVISKEFLTKFLTKFFCELSLFK